MKFFVYSLIVFVVLVLSSCSNEKILTLHKVPANTPLEDVYIMGDFNNWNPADSNYKMEYDALLKTYSIVISDNLKHATYKYTRGSNNTIETDICGNSSTNRLMKYEDLVLDTVESWADLEHINCPVVTFLIRADEGILPNNETIYLATENSQWLNGKNDYLFTYELNGEYALTILRNSQITRFNVFRGKQQQFNEPILIPNNNDTVFLTLAFNKPKNNTKENETAAEIKNNSSKKEAQPKAITLTPNASAPAANVLPSDVAIATSETKKTNVPTPIAPDPVIVTKTPAPVVAPKPSAAVVAPKPLVSKPAEVDNRKKVIVIIDKQPSYGKADNLFLAGDFNNWDIADPNYMFKPLPNGKKYLMLRLNDTKQHEFKITRGESGTDEADFKEQEIDFHEIAKGNKDDTIHIRIDSWLDAYARKKLVIYLIDVPENTPEKDDIFLTGNFNNWNTNDEQYKFTSLGGDKYALVIDDFGKKYSEYKITRGSWETEATARSGRVPKGQPFDFIKRDTIKMRIERWRDIK